MVDITKYCYYHLTIMAKNTDTQLFSLYLKKPLWRKLKKISDKEYMSMTSFIAKSLESLVNEKYSE